MTAAYEYRVVARNDEGETAASAALSVYYYRPGSGTGLQGAVWWPYAPDSNGLDQTRNVVPLGVGVVDVARPAGEDLVPGVASGARYVWDGTLICPAGGSYTFTAFYRKKTAEDWAPFATWTDAAFPRAVAVGFMTCGSWGTEPFDVDVGEIALRLTRDPLLIIVR